MMELTIKSPIEEYKYLVSPDVAHSIIICLDKISSESGSVVRIKGESLLGDKE